MRTVPESRYTPPSPWQPHPERWHAPDDDPDSSETEVTDLVTALVCVLRPQVVVETGTATGTTAEAIGMELNHAGRGHLWTVEIDPEAAGKARDALKGLPVTVITGDSLLWTPPGDIDFAWIDSGTAEVRCREIKRWRHRFRPGAVVAVHDTAPNMGREALFAAAGDLFQMLGWPFLNLRTPRGVIIAQAV